MAEYPFGKRGWTPDRLRSLRGKTYLITGANAGTGFEAAKILLRHGGRVVMLNRNPKKSERAIAALQEVAYDPDSVSYIKTDLAELASVREAAAEVLHRERQIDALICNAAIAQIQQRRFTVDGFESQLGTNHFGHFLLMSLLFDRIESSSGRFVIVGSEGYKMGLRTIRFEDLNFNEDYKANSAYAQSKLAQIMTGYELQRRLVAAEAKAQVYVCHPGSSKTSLIRNDAPGTTRFLWSLLSALPLVQSAECGAYPEVMCATEPMLDQRAYYGPTGLMNWRGPVGPSRPAAFVYGEAISKRLWKISEEATRTKFQVG